MAPSNVSFFEQLLCARHCAPSFFLIFIYSLLISPTSAHLLDSIPAPCFLPCTFYPFLSISCPPFYLPFLLMSYSFLLWIPSLAFLPSFPYCLCSWGLQQCYSNPSCQDHNFSGKNTAVLSSTKAWKHSRAQSKAIPQDSADLIQKFSRKKEIGAALFWSMICDTTRGGSHGKESAWVRKIFWRRKWLPTPVFLPGESHGHEEPDGLQSMGSQESDTTDQLTLSLSKHFLFLVGLQPALNASTLSAFSFPSFSRPAKISLR